MIRLMVIVSIALACGTAHARDITLHWDEYTDVSAVGFHVYAQEYDFTKQACQSINPTDSTLPQATRLTTAVIPRTDSDDEPIVQHTLAVDDDKSYCLFLRGVDAGGNESDNSNAVLFFAPKLPIAIPNARAVP